MASLPHKTILLDIVEPFLPDGLKCDPCLSDVSH